MCSRSYSRCWRSGRWVEIHTYVVETGEAGTADILYAVVWDQEPLFPAHEDSTAIAIGDRQMRLFQLFDDMVVRWEPRPVNLIFMFVRTPFLCQETIPTANNFGVEVSGQFRPIVGQALDAEVATKERSIEINVHDGDVDFIAISSAFLRPLELRTLV